AWDEDLRLALDWDVRAESSVRVETCAGLAPLLVPSLAPELLAQVVQRLEGPGFLGAAGLTANVIVSTVPGSAGFQPRTYWRRPIWPVANWLLWWGLRQHGRGDLAARLRAANLELLERPTSRFAEDIDPDTAEPLG